MLFKDPIRTIQADIAAGWAYDPFNSTLTDFVFSRWDQPHEMLAIHVRRSSLPPDSPDEEWTEKIRTETKGNATLTELPSAGGRAVVAEFKLNRGWAQRVAFVRGPRVEIVIEQRSTLQTGEETWRPLERAVRTAESGANLELPVESRPEEFNRSVQAVNQAFEEDDPSAIETALKNSINLGISAWLYSMAMPDRALEINAAVRVAQALMHLGVFTGDLALSRDAEFILRRAQHSLEAAGPETEWAQELQKQISETLKTIWSGLVDPSQSEDSASMSPVLSLRERGFRTANAAAKAFELRDSESALNMASNAAEDLMSLVAFLRQNRTQEIPEDIVAHLSEQGITEKEQQIDAIQRAREAVLFPPLNMATQIRHCCALSRGDIETAVSTAAIRVPLARQIFDSIPEDAGTALNLALAMMDSAGASILRNKDGALQEASQYLDEAMRILDSAGDTQNGNHFWIHHHKAQLDASLEAFDRSPEQTPDLSALHSRFQAASIAFQEAAARLTP